jgi:hypothetical protein
MDKFLNILIILVAIILLAITVVAKATETSNVLNNGSFDGNADGWDLDGTAEYDGKTYSASGLSKVIRFSGGDGGSITQSITLGNINSDTKYISKVHGSIKSYGCNNSSGAWCSATGTDNNLDPVNTTITFNDGTQTEVLNYDFTSNYNDGVITSTFTINLDKDFHINNTTINVNVFGADKGNQAGMLGSIIDDLSLTLTLANLTVIPEVVIPTIQIGNLDSTSIADTISTGIIDIKPIEDMQIQGMNIADANHNHEMPVQEIQTIDMPELQVEMPDIQMPDLEMPDIEMPDNLPVEINNVEIEPVNEPEPETLQEIREEIPVELEPEELKQEDTHEKDVKQENKEKENGVQDKTESSKKEKEEENEGVLKEPAKNEKAVTPTKTTKVEKKRGSESPNKSVKKVLGTTVTPKIESNIIVKELDLLTVVSFNKQYFENTYKDIISLTTTEVAFYEQDGFNSTDYTKANTNFFSEYRNTNSEWDMVSKRDHIKIEQFRR